MGTQANHLDHLQTSASGAETRVTCGFHSIIQLIDLVRVPAGIREVRASFSLIPMPGPFLPTLTAGSVEVGLGSGSQKSQSSVQLWKREDGKEVALPRYFPPPLSEPPTLTHLWLLLRLSGSFGY